jgi:hypothetical protein
VLKAKQLQRTNITTKGAAKKNARQYGINAQQFLNIKSVDREILGHDKNNGGGGDDNDNGNSDHIGCAV